LITMTRGQTAVLGAISVGLLAIGGVIAARQSRPPVMAGAAGPAGPVEALSSGAGVGIEFSDKPVAVPAFSLADLDGKPVRMEDLRGKVVVLNFWATWCGPCREEIPMLIELQKHYRDRLAIVGLSIDDGPAEDVRRFIKQFGVNYVVAIAPEALQIAFGGISAVPTTFIVNPAGQIVRRHRSMLAPALTEHEVRVLAGLPSEAHVQVVKDEGQILAENAPPVSEIKDLPMADLTPAQKEDALRRLNSERCTCGCGLTVGRCRVDDPTCSVSPPLAKKIVDDVRRKR
jgi:thiol-disulfide isomerase/thioredoxin